MRKRSRYSSSASRNVNSNNNSSGSASNQYKRNIKNNRTSDVLEVKVKNRSFGFLSNGTFIQILGIVVLILLFASILSTVLNGSPQVRSFGGLLESLQGLKSVDINWIYTMSTTNLGDWGFLNFLRDFVSYFIPVVQYLLLIVTGFINALGGIVQIIGYFLGF